MNGPATFRRFDDLLAGPWSSIRRGASRRCDGGSCTTPFSSTTEVGCGVTRAGDSTMPSRPRRSPRHPRGRRRLFDDLLDTLGRIQVPLLLARGMRQDSVLRDDDEAELLRRLPSARGRPLRGGRSQHPRRHASRAGCDHPDVHLLTGITRDVRRRGRCRAEGAHEHQESARRSEAPSAIAAEADIATERLDVSPSSTVRPSPPHADRSPIAPTSQVLVRSAMDSGPTAPMRRAARVGLACGPSRDRSPWAQC